MSRASDDRGTGLSTRALAEMLGLSPATVSRALNNHPEVSPKTRAKVLDAADDAGYFPSGAGRTANVIGLVYPSHPVSTEYGSFESALLAGVLRGVAEQRFDVTVMDIARDRQPGENFARFFRRKGVRGALVRTPHPTPQLAEELADAAVPSVLVADHSNDPRVNFICSDAVETSASVIDHLAALGHQRVALVIHHVMDSNHRDRREGYLRGLERNDLAYDESLIIESVGSMEGGPVAIDRAMSLPEPPTAMYITNPLTTVGALRRCLELRIEVPRDLSIVGFDDSDVRYHTFPTFTAVCQDAAQLGLEAARWLTRSIAGAAAGPLRERRPTTISYNRSTGPAPVRPWRFGQSGDQGDRS